MAFERAIAQTLGFVTVDSTDHVTPTVPTTPVATWSKDGAGFAPATNAVSSIASGACKIPMTLAECTCDLGILRVTSDNCDPVMLVVYFEASYTATRAALIGTPTAATIAAAVWNYLTSAMTTAGSIGKKLADWVISGVIGFGFGPYKLSADETELEVYRADDVDIPVTLYSDETQDTVLDLTLANKVYFTVKEETDAALDAAADTNAVIGPVECTVSAPATSGIITVPLTKVHTAALTPLVWYAFDIQVIWTGGDVQTVVVGRIRSRRDVTRKATV